MDDGGVFDIPESLLGSNKKRSKLSGETITLLDALNFQGGHNTKGAVEILMRAAVAGLLNEAAFGAYYPPYGSVGELITAVNTVVNSGDRAAMLDLANQIDYWNNGVH